MRFSKFEFNNFRGLSSTTLDLTRSPKEAVNVLVGLNESGKTTVLEAINHFRSNPNLKKKNPNFHHKTEVDFQAMIPIGKRAFFNESISVTSTLEMSSEDILIIDNFLKENFGFVEVKYRKKFDITYEVIFENSKKKKINNTWDILFYGRKRKGKTEFKALNNSDWIKTAKYIADLLPKVMYFPSSLLEFPDRILLEIKSTNVNNDEITIPNVTSFYFEVIADVLKAIDNKLDIEKHILTRAKSSTPSDIQNLDALIQKIEQHLNQTVLGEWKKTLGVTLGSKRFRFYIKSNEDGLVYAEIKLSDGSSLFSLNERSAGFRWFFAFIMLVNYRIHRNDRVLFLFDEPAANLHPRAQMQLLQSFAQLSKTHQFLFTTHSHYLINPLWLESTFIVKNEAFKIDDDSFNTDPSASEISITPYRTFVGTHPDQHFYYRPIMDALEYTPPQISPECASILIEGKTDYYCIEYFKIIYFADEFDITLFPGGGSSGLDSLISLLSGWAVEYLIVLDGDKSGDSEKARYEEKFESLVENRIKTLSDILNRKTKTRIEELFDKSDLELIRLKYFPNETNLTKKLLHKAIQEMLAGKLKLNLSQVTIDNFKNLLNNLKAQYEVQKLL